MVGAGYTLGVLGFEFESVYQDTIRGGSVFWVLGSTQTPLS